MLKGFQGAEVQNFDKMYLKKKKCFEQHFRTKVAQNAVLNNILH